MKKSSKSDDSTIDFHAVFKKGRQVPVIATIAEVQDVRPDLNDNQALAVLQQCRQTHHCRCAFAWKLVAEVADALYPNQK